MFIVTLNVWPSVLQRYPDLLLDNEIEFVIVTNFESMNKNEVRDALKQIRQKLKTNPVQVSFKVR